MKWEMRSVAGRGEIARRYFAGKSPAYRPNPDGGRSSTRAHSAAISFDDVLNIGGIPQGSLLTAFRPTSGRRRRVDD
jgi:hypothetical protein